MPMSEAMGPKSRNKVSSKDVTCFVSSEGSECNVANWQPAASEIETAICMVSGIRVAQPEEMNANSGSNFEKSVSTSSKLDPL